MVRATHSWFGREVRIPRHVGPGFHVMPGRLTGRERIVELPDGLAMALNVARAAGHSTPATTMRFYAHARPVERAGSSPLLTQE